jgi:formylglycine-generating enzyme required for sulfatase activity
VTRERISGFVRTFAAASLTALTVHAAALGREQAAKRKKKTKTAPAPVKATETEKALVHLDLVNVPAVRLAMADLAESHPRRSRDASWKRRLADIERSIPRVRKALEAGDESAIKSAEEMFGYVRGLLLANPALDFDKLLFMRRRVKNARGAMGPALGHPRLNSHTLVTVRHTGWDNAIVQLSGLRGAQRERVVHKPANGAIVTDFDLHFDAERLMFSSIGTHDRWHLFEIGVDGSGLRQLTPEDLIDVDHFDSCYLPDDRIAFTSTAAYQGLPCEYGSKLMAQLYRLDPRSGEITQLTFEQDSDWTPAMLPDGRLMYLRWEYTDTPHYFTRVLMSMNPDGTDQRAIYGSNSYFPNGIFYAKPMPGGDRIVGIVGGHHGISRSGRMMIVDPGKGRANADGMVHEFSHRGRKVEAKILDRLIDGVWPQFVHPHPLDDKYFVAAVKPSPKALWGLYLVDVFDNLTLIREEEGAALLEPVPLVKTRRPRVVADRTRPGEKHAVVFLQDIYRGPGLAGVERGAVRKLRVGSYDFAHLGQGGHNSVGIESGWDVKRILGTVPVEKDGSAVFRVPANTPLFLQPLDGEGRALQLFRSWFVGKPGEFVSCIGCHENLSGAPPAMRAFASGKAPVDITPWRGPPRPFAFRLEVQPVLDKYCVGCHDGKEKGRPNFADRDEKQITVKRQSTKPYSGAYVALQYYVRRPGPESDYRLLRPMEYHASTSELVQMLAKGHHGVRLPDEARERIHAWIDLNAPFRGRWYPGQYLGLDQHEQRLKYAEKYAGITTDPTSQYEKHKAKLIGAPLPEPLVPAKGEPAHAKLTIPGWPLGPRRAKEMQSSAGQGISLDLGEGQSIALARVPAGRFVMGSVSGYPDEGPPAAVEIDGPFHIGIHEVTNAQYARFDPAHDSRAIDMPGKDHKVPGYPADGPTQPVVRVSWREAMAFCEWLGKRAGRKVALPTEAQWEWACRAGTDTDFWWGGRDADFSGAANLADQNIRRFDKSVKSADKKDTVFWDRYIPRVDGVNDRNFIACAAGSYAANPWGLHDMHGNVCEWTRSSYRAYPYSGGDGRNDLKLDEPKAVRGGSWRDRPKRATSSFRLSYGTRQKVFNVGFRIVVE